MFSRVEAEGTEFVEQIVGGITAHGLKLGLKKNLRRLKGLSIGPRIKAFLTKCKKFRFNREAASVFSRRTVITFEKLERSFYYLPSSEANLSGCDECGEEVTWLTPNQVVVLTGLTLREIFRRIELNTIHFSETPTGLLHICPKSLELELTSKK